MSDMPFRISISLSTAAVACAILGWIMTIVGAPFEWWAWLIITPVALVGFVVGFLAFRFPVA